jgi:photosystem II stability/assembly factor-like uncharacterized protein
MSRMRLFDFASSHCCAVLVLLIGFASNASAYSDWIVSNCGDDVSLRGLCVASDEVIWASGSKGTIVRSVDGGATWSLHRVAGYEMSEFRSIHAWNERQACVASAGTPAVILRTEDGGGSWQEVYRNDSPQAFFDAIAFEGPDHGFVMSDPVDGRFLIVETLDGGKTWRDLPELERPVAENGEAAFAASSGSMVIRSHGEIWIGTGGKTPGTDRGRLLRFDPERKEWNYSWTNLPRNESSGIFALHFGDDRFAVIVGGDYKNESNSEQAAGWSDDGGITWHPAHSMPSGYRSSVWCWANGDDRFWMTAGPNGTDTSPDGKNWTRASDEGFHVVRCSPTGQFWGAGSKGRIGKWK